MEICHNCIGEIVLHCHEYLKTPALFPYNFRVLPTDCKQALLYSVPLGLGEATAFRQAVNRVQQGVDQRGEGLRPRKQWCTLGEKRQHSGTQIPVEGKGHVCSTEGGLEHTIVGTQRESMFLILNIYKTLAQFDMKQSEWKKKEKEKKALLHSGTYKSQSEPAESKGDCSSYTGLTCISYRRGWQLNTLPLSPIWL